MENKNLNKSKNFKHRIATFKDIPEIKKLMELSINDLLGPLLTPEQLEASFDSMGLDDQLIKDGTYFMIFNEDAFVGCGGWSNRETLFGGNHTPNRDDNFLDPAKDSARIRAMYTHPDWTRQGIGSLVIHLGENAAKKLGFKKCELMATQSGKLLYETQGYKPIEEIEYQSNSGKTVPMVRMRKKFSN
ncbi:MAG: GNAT family N-acetyltransferase [Gammaproteobacteria bacterium]|nr:GNAT family N-acetyltransferase [Gammaproteobacteria bacterium]